MTRTPMVFLSWMQRPANGVVRPHEVEQQIQQANEQVQQANDRVLAPKLAAPKPKPTLADLPKNACKLYRQRWSGCGQLKARRVMESPRNHTNQLAGIHFFAPDIFANVLLPRRSSIASQRPAFENISKFSRQILAISFLLFIEVHPPRHGEDIAMPVPANARA